MVIDERAAAPLDTGAGSVGGAGLATRAASGVAWLTVQTWVAKLGGFVTLMLLTRLLDPADFGVVAVAMTVVSLVSLIADLGFGTYLTQVGELTPRLVSTAWWYSVGSGLVLAGTVALAAPLIESAFGIDGVAGVMVAISPAVLFVGVSAVPIALLRRRLRFRALALQAVLAAIVAQVVAVVLALAGLGVWALVAQVVVAQGIILVASWTTSRLRPRAHFSGRDFGIMVRFGSSVVGINLVAAARLSAENAIVAQVLGAAALGRLSIAQRLVLTTQEAAGAAIAPVSTVVFAQVRDDPARLRRGYDRALSLAYVVIAPAMTFIFVASSVLVPFVFGEAWTAAAGLASALAVAAIFTITATVDHGLFLGSGRPGRWLVYAVGIDALTLATTAVLVPYGIVAVAVGFVGVAAFATIVRAVLVSRLLAAPLWSVARRTVAALACMAVSAGCGWLVLQAVAVWPAAAALAVVGLTVLVVHVAVARMLLPAALDDLRREIAARLRSSARSSSARSSSAKRPAAKRPAAKRSSIGQGR